VSIGDALATARRQAGLSIAQVSQRTCIRETIIRGIEGGDYSACGGDFYARGHIRSIARAVGADPEAIIREYDLSHGSSPAITAAEDFHSPTPVKFRERRRPNWTAAMALALAVIAGLVAYHVVRPQHTSAAAGRAAGAHAGPHQKRSHAIPKVSPAGRPRSRAVVIHLTAVQDCWVQLTTAAGQTIFTGLVYAGTARSWTERHAVSLRIGDPGAITLTVNGRSRSPGPPGEPVTLSFGPGQRASN
jgi:cytoskeletal protein RodZ